MRGWGGSCLLDFVLGQRGALHCVPDTAVTAGIIIITIAITIAIIIITIITITITITITRLKVDEKPVKGSSLSNVGVGAGGTSPII